MTHELTTALDQPMPIPEKAKQETFRMIDGNFAEALRAKDSTIAFDAGIKLIQLSNLSGLALAKMAYLLSTRWDEFEDDEPFIDKAMELWGKSRTYLERLISIWDKYEQEQMPDVLMDRPIKDQQAIAKMIDQGFEPNKNQWMRLEDAEDNSAVLREIREIKGIAQPTSTRSITLKRSGDLVGYINDKQLHLGWLNIIDQTDEDVLKLINQIVVGGGIKRV
jgi:hypothetical protein